MYIYTSRVLNKSPWRQGENAKAKLRHQSIQVRWRCIYSMWGSCGHVRENAKANQSIFAMKGYYKATFPLEFEGPWWTHDIRIVGSVENPETVQVYFTLDFEGSRDQRNFNGCKSYMVSYMARWNIRGRDKKLELSLAHGYHYIIVVGSLITCCFRLYV